MPFGSILGSGEHRVTGWKTGFPDTPMPAEVGVVRRLQKLEALGDECSVDALARLKTDMLL